MNRKKAARTILLAVAAICFVFRGHSQTCASVPSGLVSWWSAESNALDNTELNNGYMVNGAGFTNGEVGSAFSFNGQNQCVRVPDSSSLRFTNGLTAEAWICPTNPPPSASDSILVKYDAVSGPNQSAFGFSINSRSQPYIALSTNGSPQGTLTFTANGTVPTNKWTHVAATFDGSQVAIYINGQLDTSTNFSGTIFPGTDDLGIGANVGGEPPGGMAAPFAGYIDEPAVYNVALTAQQIGSIFGAGSAGKCPLLPTITSNPTNETVQEGGVATFAGSAAGSQPLSYQWTFTGTNISGATQSKLTLVNVGLNQAGTYNLIISNAAGSVITSGAVLTVNPPGPCEPAPSGIVSWWSAESNSLDNISENNGALINGASFGPGLVGTAFTFNGSTQCVRVPDAPSLRFTNGFTAEAWMYLPKPATQNSTVISKYDAVGAMNQRAYSLGINSSQNPYMFISTNGAENSILTGTNVMFTNVWIHLAATFDGSTMSIYVNGVLDSAIPLSGWIFPGTDDLAIGGTVGGEGPTGVASPFPGSIDEPAVYGRALSAAEIQNIYYAGMNGKCQFSPSFFLQPSNQTVQMRESTELVVGGSGTQPLSYQWTFDGTNIAGATGSILALNVVQMNQSGSYGVVVSNSLGAAYSSNATLTVTAGPPCADVSSNLVSAWSGESNAWDNVGGNNGTLINNVSYVIGISGYAFNLSGNGQSVRVPDAPNLRFTNGLTAEAWICLTNKPSSVGDSILVKYDALPGPNQSAFGFSINLNSQLYIALSTNGSPQGAFTFTANGTVPTNKWTHVAATFDGSQVAIYINGQLDTSTNFSGTIFPGTDDLGIGANVGGEPPGGMAAPFAGYIDEPAVYNRALSATQILSIYNAGIAGKCFPSSPPVIYMQPSNITSLPGTNVTLAAFASGSANLNYQWSFNGANLPNATNRMLTFTNVQLANAGNYVSSVSNAFGTATSSTAVLNVILVTAYANGLLLTNSQYSHVGPVTLQLKNYYTNGYTFYTLDGSTPTPDSMYYTESFILSNNAVVTALGYTPDFQEYAYSAPVRIAILPGITLSATTPGGGSILLNPSNATYTLDTIVSVTARPSNGWTFLGWQGNIAGLSLTNSVLMSRAKTIQAIFGTTVSASASAGGTVVLNPAGGMYPYGTLLQASAIPQSGNQFIFWGDSVSGNANPLLYSVTNTNATLAALFGSLSAGQEALTVVPVGHGTVALNPNANTYTSGQPVTISVTPDSGATFKDWSGDATGTNNPLTVIMNQSKTIYANFSTNFNLSLQEGPGAGFSEGIELDLSGELGSHYRLDASTDLMDWMPLFNLTNYVGTLEYLDTNAEYLPLRFYRAVLLP